MFTEMTYSPYETIRLAEKVGKRIREGTVLCLDGELGMGKTLFVQSLARTLGVESEVNLIIKSQYGWTSEISNVQPFLYHVRYFRNQI